MPRRDARPCDRPSARAQATPRNTEKAFRAFVAGFNTHLNHGDLEAWMRNMFFEFRGSRLCRAHAYFDTAVRPALPRASATGSRGPSASGRAGRPTETLRQHPGRGQRAKTG